MFEDKTLKCVVCGEDFTFTAGEQQFYDEKGFTNEPKKCKDCRQAAKNGGRGERTFFEATCAGCGGVARVPFQPREGREVYCSDCYSKQQGE